MDVLLKEAGKLQYQDNWEGSYRNGRVACLDYTQLRQHAASDVLNRCHLERLEINIRETQTATPRAPCYSKHGDGLGGANAVGEVSAENRRHHGFVGHDDDLGAGCEDTRNVAGRTSAGYSGE
jgi:hypothetical protein